MSHYQDILNDLKTACVAVLSKAVFTSYEELQKNITQSLIDVPETIWIIDLGEEVQETGYSIDSPTYRVPCTIYLVSTSGHLATNVQDYLSGYMETLRLNIRNQVLTTCQGIEDGIVNASVSNEVMATMLGRSVSGVVGATLTFQPGLLYGF